MGTGHPAHPHLLPQGTLETLMPPPPPRHSPDCSGGLVSAELWVHVPRCSPPQRGCGQRGSLGRRLQLPVPSAAPAPPATGFALLKLRFFTTSRGHRVRLPGLECWPHAPGSAPCRENTTGPPEGPRKGVSVWTTARLARTGGSSGALVGSGGQPQALACSRWASTCLRGPGVQHQTQTQGDFILPDL